MTNEDAIKWLENLTSDIGNPHYECLWHYAQALVEIAAMLKEQEPVELIDDGDDFVSIGDKMELTNRWKCGGCGYFVVYCETRPKIKFCHMCGREFKGMIVFELTMPHCGSWNGKWSQEHKLHVRTKDERKVPKECWDKDFYYRWDDGWTACVTTRRMSVNEARKLERRSDGFCGYDWMIRSICKNGVIEPEGK